MINVKNVLLLSVPSLVLLACSATSPNKRLPASVASRDLTEIRVFDAHDVCSSEEQRFIDFTLASLPDKLIQLKKKFKFSCATLSHADLSQKKLLNVVLRNSSEWNIIIKSKIPPTDAILRKEIVRTIALAYDHENNTSKTESWRALSSWQGKKIPFLGTIRQIQHTENINKDGFADPLGMKSPSLDFATYAEEFFSNEQSGLKCRTQSKFKYLKNIFSDFTGAQDNVICSTVENWINPSEVDSLELFIASATSSAPESMAGHLMLRVKMKYHKESGVAPGTEDPDDPVLSIVANIPTFTGNLEMMLNGITGEYPSTIDVLRLGDVVMNSTFLEDRDLRRFKLTLSNDQIRSVLERLYESKNSFSYNYAFFGNNCSTLMIKQIAMALGDYKLLDEANSVGTPDTFTEMLIRHNYAEQVFPTFFSRSKKAELSKAQQKKILSKYQNTAGNPFSPAIVLKVESKVTTEREEAYEQLRDVAIAGKVTPDTAFDIYQWLSFQRNVEESWEMEKYLKDNDLFHSPYNAVLDTVYKTRSVLKSSPNTQFSSLAGLKKSEFLANAQKMYSAESDKIAYQYEKQILVAQEKNADKEQTAMAIRMGLPANFMEKIHSHDDITRMAAYRELIKVAQAGPNTNTEDALRFVVFMYPFERITEINRVVDQGLGTDPDFNYQSILLSFYQFRNVLANNSDQYLRSLVNLNRDDFFTRIAYWRHAKLTDDSNYAWIADVTFNYVKYEIEEVKKRQLRLASEIGLDPSIVEMSWQTENKPREEAYKKITEKFATTHGENIDKITMILLHSWRVESYIFATKGNQIHQANKSLEGLKRVIVRVMVRSPAKLSPNYANKNELSDVQLLEKDHETAEAQIGSARTGINPLTVSAGTSVVNWKGVYQMTIDSSTYTQSIGDPSRFIIGKNNISLRVMPSRLIITMDPEKGVDISGSSSLLEFVKAAEKYGHPKTIFEGKVGLSMRVLEFNNSRWTDRPSEWTWINPNVVATIAASPDFMSYLNVSIGASVGSSMIVNDQGNTNFGWAGVPMRIDSQVTLGEKKRAQLSLDAEYIPRFNFVNTSTMDQCGSATMTGTWLLGNFKKAEVRLKVQSQAEYYRYREYILGGLKSPTVLNLRVGLNIRSK